jgi:hypothetical protein
MENTFNWNRELNELALHFALSEVVGSIKDRSHSYAKEISDDRFHELAEYVLNESFEDRLLPNRRLRRIRDSFVRALMMNGYDVRTQNDTFQVKPRFSPDHLQKTKEESATLLKQMGFEKVQGSLDIAEQQYVEGEFAKSLWNSRKALEDLMKLLADKLGVEQKDFLNKYISSDLAREIIKKIDYYACKGHEVQIPEYEAIFGYNLVISAIYHLLLLQK